MEEKLYESIEAVILDQDDFSQYKNTFSIKDRIKLVGENLSQLRKTAGLSQKEVAKIIDCAIQTYSGYEKGRHEPNIESLVRNAHLYNVSVDTIVGKDVSLYEMEDDIYSETSIKDWYMNPKFEQLQRKLKSMEQDIENLKKNVKDI